MDLTKVDSSKPRSDYSFSELFTMLYKFPESEIADNLQEFILSADALKIDIERDELIQYASLIADSEDHQILNSLLGEAVKIKKLYSKTQFRNLETKICKINTVYESPYILLEQMKQLNNC